MDNEEMNLGTYHAIDAGIHLGNQAADEVMVLANDTNARLLLIGNGITFNGVNHCVSFLFE